MSINNSRIIHFVKILCFCIFNVICNPHVITYTPETAFISFSKEKTLTKMPRIKEKFIEN